jgi:hypothetical protein
MQKKANDRAGILPGIVVGASAAGIVLSSRWLPDQVVWNLGAAGQPEDFAGRGTYLLLMLVLAVALPLLVRFALVACVRARLGALPLPNREFWLAAERYDATHDYLVRQTAWIAAGVAVSVFLAHLFVELYLNRAGAPRQAPHEWLMFFAGVAGLFALWAGAIAWHFRKP